MSNKKKIGIIAAIIVISFVIMGFVYAFFSDNVQITNKIKIGTVRIDDLNLTLKKENGTLEDVLEPADIDTISWTTKNIGTSGVLTRHILEIYWQEDTDIDASNLLYLYPANISKQAILTDFEKIQKGEESTYLIKTESINEEVSGGKKYGMKYKFVGDALNGSDGNEVSKEVNYNSTEATIIDENISTDDTSKTDDEISFRVLVTPKLSYLFQGKPVSIKVTTEAMQYTEEGEENWTVVDTIEVTL